MAHPDLPTPPEITEPPLTVDALTLQLQSQQGLGRGDHPIKIWIEGHHDSYWAQAAIAETDGSGENVAIHAHPAE